MYANEEKCKQWRQERFAYNGNPGNKDRQNEQTLQMFDWHTTAITNSR